MTNLLNIDGENVQIVKLTASYVNEEMLEQADVPDELLTALDEAQAQVMQSEDPKATAFVLIEINLGEK